jgi:hypothetical protein
MTTRSMKSTPMTCWSILASRATGATFFEEWSEWYRMLKPDGVLCGISPRWDSAWAWGDPGHTRIVGPECMTYLNQEEYTNQVGKSPMTDYRFVWKGDFRRRFIWRWTPTSRPSSTSCRPSSRRGSAYEASRGSDLRPDRRSEDDGRRRSRFTIWLLPHGEKIPHTLTWVSAADIEDIRNLAVTSWYDGHPEYSHLLFIDSDMGFPCDPDTASRT